MCQWHVKHCPLGWPVVVDDLSDFAFICGTVLLKGVIGVGLGRGLRVRVVEQILNTKKYLLDCNCRSPIFLFVEN